MKKGQNMEKVYSAGMCEDCFQSFLHIPSGRRIPEIDIVADRPYPGLIQARPDVIPEAVKSGCNVYTLGQLLEKVCGGRFGMDTVKRLHEGASVHMKQFVIPKGMLKDRDLRFSKEDSRFRYGSPHRESWTRRGIKP